ncbi:MAG TPA: DUF4147 domain-containing protein [Gemmatimonadales bacterium]|nr:DUF4147 domain-containing protein [Gemmatimonadales bacterium]
MDRTEIRAALERWYRAAVDAAEPAAAMRRVLAGEPRPHLAPAILAIGKAAHGMARGAVAWLAELGLDPAGGVVIAHAEDAPAHPSLVSAVGDHPLPASRSLAASAALAEAIARVPPGAPVMVLLSGGASSLIAAPLDGITPEELRRAFLIFHEIGFEIEAMNALRRRLTLWSGGRLAAALHGHEVTAWVISDVIGNDLATIGSGPLVPENIEIGHLLQALTQPGLLSRLPTSVVSALKSSIPGVVRSIPHRIVADSRTAAEGARSAIARAGYEVVVHRRPLRGPVEAAVGEVVAEIDEHRNTHRVADRPGHILTRPIPREPEFMIWTGETTIELPRGHGHGGRAQQFALMAASALASFGEPDAASILAAGTDGRDGPTDAAGAVVDAITAADIAARGINIDESIARADAYPALAAVGALMRTGPTGTNVADVVIAQVWNWY